MSAESNNGPSDRISWLAGKDVGMAMISPTKDDPDGAVALLRELNATLEKDGVRRRLDKLIDDGDESVRLIQAGRYEFFLYASGKKTCAFDEITKEMSSDTKQRILAYATTSAAEDPRLEGGFNYQFGNFSLIVSYGRVPAQAPHIDVVNPNHQFGLIVTDGVQGTLVPEKLETRVGNVDDLLAIWENLAAEFGLELPTKLAIALRADSTVRKLVASFGDVLLPQKNFDHMVGCPSLSAGSILSLPGNQVHGAPGIIDDDSFRAIIFFSAWPTGTIAVDAYDADTQYTGSLLSGHIVDLLWCQPNIGYNERLFLLHILERYVTESPVPDIALHFPEGDLSNFIRAVELSQFPTERDAFLRSTARNKRFCRQHEQYVEDERLDTEIDLGSLERLSVRDLVTKWRGQEYRLAICSRGDGSVLLHYPSCKDKDTGFECFEGADDGERFTLTMDDPAGKRLFDGTNGVLLDAWQRPVRCFRKRTSEPKPSSPSGKPAPGPVRMSSRKQAVAKRKYDTNITLTAIDSPDTSDPAPTGIKTRLRAKSVGVQEDSEKSSDATEIINVEKSKRAPETPAAKPAPKPADTSAPVPMISLQPRTTRLRAKSVGVQEGSDKSSDVTDATNVEAFPGGVAEPFPPGGIFPGIGGSFDSLAAGERGGPAASLQSRQGSAGADRKPSSQKQKARCAVKGCPKQSQGGRFNFRCAAHFRLFNEEGSKASSSVEKAPARGRRGRRRCSVPGCPKRSQVGQYNFMCVAHFRLHNEEEQGGRSSRAGTLFSSRAGGGSIEKPQVESESFPEKLKGPGSKVLEIYDVREAGGRTVKGCSVPGCQKQSRGLRCRGMCQRHFIEGGGKQAGGTNAIGGLEANNDLSDSSLASGDVGGRSRSRSRSPRKRNDATGIADWRWCRVDGCPKQSQGGRCGYMCAAHYNESRGEKKRTPEKPSKPSAQPPEIPAVEERTGPPSSKKRRLHHRAAGTSQCGRCDACMVEDCGACTHCKDMKRFGGPGKLKNRCKHRPMCEVRGLK